MSLGGYPNFDLGRRKKKNSTNPCSLSLFAKHNQFSIFESFGFSGVCGWMNTMHNRLWCLSSIRLSCFNAFCLSCSTMKLKLLWVLREIMEKLLTPQTAIASDFPQNFQLLPLSTHLPISPYICDPSTALHHLLHQAHILLIPIILATQSLQFFASNFKSKKQSCWE